MYSYFMIYYQSLAYKLKMAPFLIDRIQQVHILAHTKDTPEAQNPSQLPRHSKTPIRGSCASPCGYRLFCPCAFEPVLPSTSAP